MIPKEQVLRLAEKCLPHLVEKDTAQRTLEASDIKLSQLCRLWAGMGHIYNVSLWNGTVEFVVKHVAPPSRQKQSFGDRRKADSYQVEANFYHKLAASLQVDDGVCLPAPYLVEHGPADGEITICMSLLRGDSIYNATDVQGALAWMAKFHAAHWGEDNIDSLVEDIGLQKNGSYWYLDTRPDEHSSMPRRGWEGRLKRAARAIDSCLKRDPMQCLIHGDPKDANIMLLDDTHQVAMYDFQYCGRGTPTRDIAYFLCSSCDEDQEEELVLYYYKQLVDQLLKKHRPPPSLEHFKDSLELAFCDYCRFMSGWGYWGYDVRERVQSFLHRLDGGKDLGSEEAYDQAIRKELW
jgi:hypothetical protein